ncbi:MAG: hypothetical protein AB2809_24400 [Candidatus Thiodiazotropha sp.]
MEREELHRRIELLRKRLEEGNLKVASHHANDSKKSLLQVRVATDGMVIPETVDGRIRSILSFIAYQSDREEWKEVVSLSEIQQTYFQRIEHAFGQPFEMMTEAGADPYKFAGWFASDTSRVADALKVTDEFVPSILEFWENISEPTWIHLEDSKYSKAVFSGEIFPDGNSNITSSTGIYFDTTILPDPFVKISSLLQFMSEEERCYEVLRLGLQVLQYKELALSEETIPIVAILPDRHQFESSYRDFVHYNAEQDSLEHAGILFDTKFEEVEELKFFLSRYNRIESLIGDLKKPDELVFATEWEGSLEDHIQRYIDEQPVELNLTSPGDAIFMHLFTRFAQSNDSFQRSRGLNGTPIIKAETSWLWFNWMLRNNSNFLQEDDRKYLHIARALNTTVPTEISWFGNVTPEAIIEIRKAGALEEIRDVLGEGVSELISANPDNFFRTGDRVFHNLDKALSEHQQKIKEIQSKGWKFAGQDVGSFLVVGGIELTAALTGLPLYGSLAATAGMSGVVPTAKELKEKLSELRSQSAAASNSGIGILFKHNH